LNAKLAGVLVLTAVCLVWALQGLEFSGFTEVLGTVQWGWMVGVFAGYLCTHALRAVRLKLLLEPHVPYGGMFSVISVGFLAINVIPLRLGELVRPYLLLEKFQVPFGASLAAILLERLLDLGSLAVLLLLLSFAVELPPQGVLVGGMDVVAAGQKVAGVALVLGSVGLAGVLAIGAPVVRILEGLPGAGPAVAGLLGAFRSGIARLLRAPAQALAVVALTVAIWSCTLAAVRCALEAFPGLPATWAAALSTWAITMTGMLVAPTPGFVGSYEAFCKASLLLWGIEGDLAVTFALVLHSSMFLFTIAIGGFFLVREGLSLRSVVRESRSTEKG
jgi:uncharacterized membrane protein YbhN (UPF0104 family)